MLNFSCILYPSYFMIVQLINNVFDLFKVIFWNLDDPFLQYLDLCIQSRIMKTFISSVIFFPFSFSLLKFKNSSDFFILSHMFHPSYKDLDTCLHRWRRQRNKTYWEWKVQWEVTPKNQLNLLLLFMMKQFGKRRNSENSRDWDEPEQRQSTNEGCKSDLVRAQHFYSQLC